MFWDVGQGDSILIAYEKSKVLIDGGPDYEADRYLSNLSLMGDCRLDLVMLTHFHSDHIAGLNRILKHCDVSSLLYPKANYDKTVFQNIMWFENIKNLNSIEIQKSLTIQIKKKLKLSIIPSLIMGNSMNNSSYAVYLHKDNFDALFMADLEIIAINKLRKSISMEVKNNLLEIYKVSHHGSITGYDREFLSNILPQKCIVSVGKENKFGHPSKKVVDDLEKLGCGVYLTSEYGSIEVPIE